MMHSDSFYYSELAVLKRNEDDRAVMMAIQYALSNPCTPSRHGGGFYLNLARGCHGFMHMLSVTNPQFTFTGQSVVIRNRHKPGDSVQARVVTMSLGGLDKDLRSSIDLYVMGDLPDTYEIVVSEESLEALRVEVRDNQSKLLGPGSKTIRMSHALVH